MLIEGTCEALKKLEELGKQVHLITNNNISNDKEFSKLFNFLPVRISISTILVNYLA
jgi:ribonucleotide monophosphatase NagD (HAD superfamily)